MSNLAIRVSGLSKQYRLGQQERYQALREVITDGLYAPIRWARTTLDGRRQTEDGNGAGHRSSVNGRGQTIWALDDVSFDVKRGEVVGIIGRNGAGKTTLLKILSRITKPTRGQAEIHGRVGSLLEVGTGFHPELTGRENTYLNGAILGMRKAEIDRKFDEIVDFAEVQKFIDTPVKRYSSGMYVRLAFAVAAHMETEVLLVDEVLAVGDAEFQKKCLGKMSELSHHGRTVLFVSHNMSAVKRLCTAGLLLENGRLHSGGNLSDVIAAYSEQFRPQSEVTFQSRPGQPAITRVTIDQQAIKNGDLILEVAFESPFPLNPPIAGVVVSSISGTPVFGSNPRFHPHNFNGGSLASGVSRLIVRSLPLSSGRYRVSVFLGDWQSDYAQKLDVLDFEFRAEQSLSLRPNSENIGHLEWPGEWSLIQAR